MLFMHSSSGAQWSAALHMWPGQPNVQALEGGMNGFRGISVRWESGDEGAARYGDQSKLLLAMEARVRTWVRAVMESYSGRRGLILFVFDSFLPERYE